MIDQPITTPPTAPTSNDVTTFRARSDAFIAWLFTFASQIIGLIAQINSTATTINEKEESTVNASAIATASANFKGTWSALSNVQASESYVYNGVFYRSLQNSVGQTPPDSSTNYQNSYWAGYGATIDMINSNLSLKANISDVQASFSNIYDLSNVTSYHLLSGKLSLSNTVVDTAYGTFLYTGNSTTPPSVSLGFDVESQWGNDISEKCGFLFVFKSRNASGDWTYVDSVRGKDKYISSSTTAAQATDTNMFTLNTVNGITTVTLGSSLRTNSNGVTYVLEVYKTTHRITGVTNQGKAYTCHYNPFSGFTIDGYEGSGTAGHEILHHLGRKLGFAVVKNLSAVTSWVTYSQPQGAQYSLYLDTTSSQYSATGSYNWWNGVEPTDTVVTTGSLVASNSVGNSYVLYGWVNSYYDKSNALIGNYEIGVYQGTGITGNKVNTRAKGGRFLYKRIDSASDWGIVDNVRGDNYLYANSSSIENTLDIVDFIDDGFILKGISANASGGQYLYMVVYDNDSGSGKSKYPRATDSSYLTLNALVPFAQGINSKGTKNTIITKNETLSGLTFTEGKNYVYTKSDGTYGVKTLAPNYGTSNPANGGDFFHVLENKWYTSAGVEIAESRNYLDAIVYADAGGQIVYVEQLPKTTYFDRVKIGNIDSPSVPKVDVFVDNTTTPPIYSGYGAAGVYRTATGTVRVYFSAPFKDKKYRVTFGPQSNTLVGFITKAESYIDVYTAINGGSMGNYNFDMTITGDLA